MAMRNLLQRRKVEAFRTWLGSRALPPIGEWEVLRWKADRPGQAMRIIFENERTSEHLTCNEAAIADVRAFLAGEPQKPPAPAYPRAIKGLEFGVPWGERGWARHTHRGVSHSGHFREGDAALLLALADIVDQVYPQDPRPEVQSDLRRIANQVSKLTIPDTF